MPSQKMHPAPFSDIECIFYLICAVVSSLLCSADYRIVCV